MTKMITECIQMSTLLFSSVEKVELNVGRQLPNQVSWYVNVVDTYDNNGAVVSAYGDTFEVAIQQLHEILTSRCADLAKKLAEHIK